MHDKLKEHIVTLAVTEVANQGSAALGHFVRAWLGLTAVAGISFTAFLAYADPATWHMAHPWGMLIFTAFLTMLAVSVPCAVLVAIAWIALRF